MSALLLRVTCSKASPSMTPVMYSLYAALPKRSSTGRRTSRRYSFASVTICFASLGFVPVIFVSSSVKRTAFGPTQPTAKRPLRYAVPHARANRDAERRALIAMETLVSAPHSGRQRWDLYFQQQITRSKSRRVHIHKKVIERHTSLVFVVSDEHRSIMNKQSRAWIGMGIIESQIAAKRSLIPHADICNLRFRIRQHRRMLSHQFAGLQGVVRHAGTNPQHAVIQFDAMQPRDLFHIDEHFRLQQTIA